MEIINGTNIIPDGVAVALGAFDGIHIGHTKLIEKTIEYARLVGCKTCVFTFDRLPSGAKYIMSERQRKEILENMGVDYLYIQHFDAGFKNLSAEDFMCKYLLQARYVSVGFNFRFGFKREGDIKMLEEFCINNHIELNVEPPVMLDGEVVSSTEIRNAVLVSEFDKASKMMGRHFCVDGEVCYGNQIGRTIGFPTANIKVDESKIMPDEGVYITLTEVDGVTYKSFTNYGCKPTFEDQNVVLESHLFNFDGDLYGKNIKIYFLQQLRGVVKFASPDELKKQLKNDKNKSLDFFSKKYLQM